MFLSTKQAWRGQAAGEHHQPGEGSPGAGPQVDRGHRRWGLVWGGEEEELGRDGWVSGLQVDWAAGGCTWHKSTSTSADFSRRSRRGL